MLGGDAGVPALLWGGGVSDCLLATNNIGGQPPPTTSGSTAIKLGSFGSEADLEEPRPQAEDGPESGQAAMGHPPEAAALLKLSSKSSFVASKEFGSRNLKAVAWISSSELPRRAIAPPKVPAKHTGGVEPPYPTEVRIYLRRGCASDQNPKG